MVEIERTDSLDIDLNRIPVSLVEEIGYAYFEADLRGNLTRVNESFCRAIGFQQSELAGRNYRHFTAPGRLRQAHELFQSAYLTGQAQRVLEYPFRRRDGTLSIAEGAVAIIRDPHGQPAGFQGVFLDVTERKQAEILLQERNQALLQAKQAAERELEIGRRIQADFLPETLPQPQGWEVSGYLKSAREVSGDFYDAFPLSGGKRIGLVVGDVCDKGVGAALFMALFRSLIRAFADRESSMGWMDLLSKDRPAPAQSAAEAEGALGRRRSLLSTGAAALKNAITLTNNYILSNHERTHMFATVFFGVLDPASGTLTYINGGQEPPILLGPQGIKGVLNPTGPAVGLLPGLEFRVEQVELEPGDILLAFTDGVLDANNPQGEFFGEERLMALFQAPAPATAQALVDRLRLLLEAHIGPASQYDDITLLAIRRKTEDETR
jgi:sigma-B regulation protein RsbU (phosphoserine phosphatase)